MGGMDIFSLIGSYGFPIVMCLMCFKEMQNMSNKFTEALSNNTLVLQKLCDKIDVGVNADDYESSEKDETVDERP